MNTESRFEDLSATDIVNAIITDDPDLAEYKTELLKTITQMKNRDYSQARITQIPISPITATRNKMQLSQINFAKRLGISVATLRSWEQGLRKPSGAAKTLLDLLARRPELIDELQVLQ